MDSTWLESWREQSRQRGYTAEVQGHASTPAENEAHDRAFELLKNGADRDEALEAVRARLSEGTMNLYDSPEDVVQSVENIFEATAILNETAP